MKTTCYFKITLIVFIFFSAGLGLLPGQQSIQNVKIGVYDSRAVALAYANSDLFQKYLGNIMTKYNLAKDQKNDTLSKKYEMDGQFQQQLLHEQTFGNGSVSNIIDKIKDKLPGVAKSTGVNIIISKWEIAYQDTSLEYVGVTPQLVKLFNPSDKTLKWIESLLKQNPIPIDELSLKSIK
jgi:hypothetical protein